MKRLLKVGSTLTVITLVFGLAACSSNKAEKKSDVAVQSAEKTLIVGHSNDTSHPVHRGFEKMDEVLRDISGGTMKLEIFPSSSLGDEVPVLETMKTGGSIDFCAPSGASVQPFSKEFLTCDFYFAFENYDQVWKFYDGEFGEYLYKTLEGTGLKGISWWDNGFRNLTTTKTEVHNPNDLKGKKIRTMSSRVHMASFNAMGAAATPIPYAELYSALQQGVVDGQENPVANIYGTKLYEVQDYIIRTRHVHDPSPLIMSQSTWDALSEEQQGWVLQSAEEGAKYMRQLSIDEEEAKLDELEKNGMTVIELSAEEHQQFVDATKNVYKDFESEISQECIDLYIKCLEDAKK